MPDSDQFAMRGVQNQPYTASRSTTFLLSRRNFFTSLVTDTATIAVQTAVITPPTGTSTFSYEEHFGNTKSSAKDGPSTGFIIGLSVAIPAVVIILCALLVYTFRKRRRKREAQERRRLKSVARPPKGSTDSSWRSGSIPSPHHHRSSPVSPLSPSGRLSAVQERAPTPEQIPNRSDNGTPIAKLGLAHIHVLSKSQKPTTIFQSRRSTLPSLPRLKIDRINTRRSLQQMPFSPDLVGAHTPSASLSSLSRQAHPHPSSSNPVSPYRVVGSPSTGLVPPRLSPAPTGNTISEAGSSTDLLPTAVSAFPYGYQSEYPEVTESSAPQPQPEAERQVEMQFLAEEERLIRERVRATEELIRLKNEEARILDRKRQLGIGR